MTVNLVFRFFRKASCYFLCITSHGGFECYESHRFFKWSNAQKVKRSRLLIKATFIILTKELHEFSKQSISGVNV